MPFGRTPGPFGKHPPTIDSGTLARTQNQKPGAVGMDAADARKSADTSEMAKAKLEVYADIAQFILDIAGIVDPTPISDGLSGLISLARGQWLDAGISVVSFIPYLGDLAKAAKLPKYLKSVRKAVKIAKVDPVWGRRLKELFEKLKQGLDKAYKELADELPAPARRQLKEIMDEVDNFLKPKGAPSVPKGGSASASGGPSKVSNSKSSSNSGGSSNKSNQDIDEKPPTHRAEGRTIDGPDKKEKPQWLKNIEEGNEFNRQQSPKYPHNEVYIDKPDGSGYYRVDSYNPRSGEIISRKHTQLSEVTEQTATNYIKEVPKKYPPGAKIAEVPSSENLSGQRLQGQMILEVPPQKSPVPQSVLDVANNAGVLVRDTSGRIY